ncbi:MAG: hypothetical protein V1725_04080 [archaeon]
MKWSVLLMLLLFTAISCKQLNKTQLLDTTAKLTEDIERCNSLYDSSLSWDGSEADKCKLVVKLAFVTKKDDPAYCENTSDIDNYYQQRFFKNECYLHFAIAQRNESWCDKMVLAYWKNETVRCKITIANFTKNYTYCDTLAGLYETAPGGGSHAGPSFSLKDTCYEILTNS